jgi:hypothetical protein
VFAIFLCGEICARACVQLCERMYNDVIKMAVDLGSAFNGKKVTLDDLT